MPLTKWNPNTKWHIYSNQLIPEDPASEAERTANRALTANVHTQFACIPTTWTCTSEGAAAMMGGKPSLRYPLRSESTETALHSSVDPESG